MHDVVGVRFQEAGKVSYFSPVGFEDLEAGEYVVVETSRGVEMARVVIAPGQVVNAELTEPLRPITRLADTEDLERAESLRARAREQIEVVRALVRERGLPMKIVDVAYTLDGARLTVYFLSDGRVDFRDLVRDLSRHFHAQVQLRQVGPRDQAKAVDGYGRCGRRLCCSSWLVSFPSISIKMAKEQNLPLNPSKISGQCGRLLCCLAYEDDTYRQLKAELPRPGTAVSTPAGDARVLAINALRQMVTLQMASMEVFELPAAALAMDRGVVRIIAETAETAEPPRAAAESAPRPAPMEPRPAPRQPQEPGRPHGRRAPERAAAEPPAAPPPAASAVNPAPASPASAQEGARPRRHRRGRRRGGGGGPATRDESAPRAGEG